MPRYHVGLKVALLCGALLAFWCLCLAAYGFFVLSRFDGPRTWRAAPDPRHLGRTDVLVVDPVDRVVRGHVVADYDGRYAGDPRWDERLRAIEEEIPAAIRDVRERLGLGDRPVPPFVVRFRDDEQMGTPVFMSTYQEVRGREVRPLIVVGVDSLLAREFDIRDALRHEIAHCWQLAALGEAFYDLPRWVQEGLADWATGRGEVRMHCLYLEKCSDPGRDPERRLLDGLEGPHDATDYGEDYLAFAWLEEVHGREAVQRLVAELFTHASYRVALKRVTGLTFHEFERRAGTWAREYVRRDLVDRPEYLAAKTAFLRRDRAGAEEAYSAYLAGSGWRTFRALALVEQAECRLEAGDAAGALALLDRAAVAEPVGPLNDRILHGRVRAASRERAWERVEELASYYLKDFSPRDVERTGEVRRMLRESREKRASAEASGGTATGGTR